MNSPSTQKPIRLKCDAPIEIYWGSSTLLARVRDMSVAGLFIETSPPLWIGATFSASLMLNPPLQINCTVRRIEPNRGMGVQVTFMDSETSQRFAHELDKQGRTG
jgi:hypothetical protein